MVSISLPLDGPDIVQQWCKFNLGALASGPCICDEWKTQGQPSGQITVSRYYVKIIVDQILCSLDAQLLKKK